MFSGPTLLCNVGLQRNLWCRPYPITSVHMLLSWAIKCPIALSVNPTDTLISICSWTGRRMKLHLVQAWLDHTARISTASLCQFAIPSNKVTCEWCPEKAPTGTKYSRPSAQQHGSLCVQKSPSSCLCSNSYGEYRDQFINCEDPWIKILEMTALSLQLKHLQKFYWLH